ncbi:MAG: OmpA family protein [Leptospirales bacterium]|nr:OmpA family protein [Leptospirales bacterium]
MSSEIPLKIFLSSIVLLTLSHCLSAERREKVLTVIRGCPTYEEEVAFPTPAAGTPTPAPAGLPEGEAKKLGAAVFLDKMLDGIRKDFEEAGIKLQKLEEGFRAHGITIERVKDTQGKTKEIRIALDGDVGFDHGSANLTAKAKEIVDKVSKSISEFPDAKVKVGGHTDSTGSRALNQQLSQDRAQAVRDRIIKQGPVAPNRFIEVRGYADTQRVINTLGNEPRNRRVEIRLVIE